MSGKTPLDLLNKTSATSESTEPAEVEFSETQDTEADVLADDADDAEVGEDALSEDSESEPKPEADLTDLLEQEKAEEVLNEMMEAADNETPVERPETAQVLGADLKCGQIVLAFGKSFAVPPMYRTGTTLKSPDNELRFVPKADAKYFVILPKTDEDDSSEDSVSE